MTSMLEYCLSGAILKEEERLSLLAAGRCLCGCMWPVERLQNLDSRASLFWKSDGV